MSGLAESLQIDPMDIARERYVATVFNLLPIEIIEHKPGMFPARFVIPPATPDNGMVGIVHIPEGHHFIDNVLIEQGKPGATFRQTTSPNVMASSIVNDYKFSHIGLGEDAEPGLFWLPGKVSLKNIKEDVRFSALMAEVQRKHKHWMKNLIALADTDWEKNHNMLAVSDLQRMAARTLGVQKVWVEFTAIETLLCPMCAITVNVMAAICSSCGFHLKPEVVAANIDKFSGSKVNPNTQSVMQQLSGGNK